MRPKIIASMTSYPARIATVHLAVESLLCQTTKADSIILWLADTQFPHRLADLPAPLCEQLERGLEIRWCDDLRSYKRQYYAFRDFPDAAVIIVDDDLIYPRDMIETLVKSWERHPNAISAMRTHLIRFDASGGLAPYNSWKYEYSGLIDVPSMSLYATPGGGTLVPPGCMHEATFDLDNITRICPTADDIWMKLMYTLTDTPVVLADENRPLLEIPETQEQALWRDNCVRNESDRQREALLEKYNNFYGEDDTLVSRMRRDATGFFERKRPALTVIVVPNGNKPAQRSSLDSALRQDFQNMELIIRSDSSATDPRARTIDACGGIMQWMTAATLASRGDYILYLMPDERLESDSACTALMDRLRTLESDPNRLHIDILDTGASELRRVAAGAAATLLAETPDTCLSGKLMRGALCRLAFRHIDADSCPNAHPAAVAFVIAVCVKGYLRVTDRYISGQVAISCDGADRVAAICSIADFLHRIGGEEAFGAAYGRLCAALTADEADARIAGMTGAIKVLTQAQLASAARRDILRNQLAEAVSVAEKYRAAADRTANAATDQKVRELEGRISEIYSSSIYRAGRIVTLLPRKFKLLLVRLRQYLAKRA